jgi:hypothetical protein
MSELTYIDLSAERQDVESGSELDRNGTQIRPCAPGSVGRYIKDYQKQKYIELDKRNNGEFFHRKTAFPKSRTMGGVQYYSEIQDNIWDRKLPEHEYDELSSSEINHRVYKRMGPSHENHHLGVTEYGTPSDYSSEAKIKTLYEDPETFYKRDRLLDPSTNFTYITTDTVQRDERYPTGYLLFVSRIQEQLLQKVKSMPPFVVTALYRYANKDNFYDLAVKADAKEYVFSESEKSKSELERVFIDEFFNIAQIILDRYGRLTRYARDLGRLNPEDMRVQNPKNLPLLIRPIRPGEKTNGSDNEENMANELLSTTNDRMIEIMSERKRNSEALQYEIDVKHRNPRPEGPVFTKLIRQNEHKKNYRRMGSQRLKEGEDPRRLFGFDPDSLRYPDRPVWIPEPTFDSLLPKGQRDLLMQRHEDMRMYM